MISRFLLILVLGIALMGTGCGTITNLKQPVLPPPSNPDAKVCRIYGGLRSDFFTIIDYPWADTPSYIDYVLLPLMAACDLGFTFVGDTLTLPYPIGAEVRRAIQNYNPSSDSPPERTPTTPQQPEPPAQGPPQ